MNIRRSLGALALAFFLVLPFGFGDKGIEWSTALAGRDHGAATAQSRASERGMERANERSALGHGRNNDASGDLDSPEKDYEEVGAESADVEGEEDVEEY